MYPRLTCVDERGFVWIYILAVTPLHKWLRLNSVGRIRKLLTAHSCSKRGVFPSCPVTSSVSYVRFMTSSTTWIDIALKLRPCKISGKKRRRVVYGIFPTIRASVVRRNIGCCYFNAAENDISLAKTR